MRTCSKCGIEKPDDEFYKIKVRGNRLMSCCKMCHRNGIQSRRTIYGTYAYRFRRYNRIRDSARKRGVVFELTLDQFWLIKNSDTCHYCKCKTDMITIDRVDNDIGYIIGNVVPCCMMCNNLKSDKFNEAEAMIIGDAVRQREERLRQTKTATQ